MIHNCICVTVASRNETYCVTGSITLHVYESSSVDMEKVSYVISATVGENLTCECPSLHNFNKTLIKWHKVGEQTVHRLFSINN